MIFFKEIIMTKRLDPNVERNLDFLRDIIRAKGMTMASFADAAGISQQLAYHYFTAKDDISLYNAQKYLEREKILIRLEVDFGPASIAQKRHEAAPGKANYTIQGDMPIRTVNPTPKYIHEMVGTDARLEFLARALDSMKCSEKELCDILEVKRGLLMYLFAKDDIKVSMLYKFSRQINRPVIWKVTNIAPGGASKSPEEAAAEKLMSLIGKVDVLETIHTKGNRYRFRIRMRDDLDISKTRSVKILSVNAAAGEITVELTA